MRPRATRTLRYALCATQGAVPVATLRCNMSTPRCGWRTPRHQGCLLLGDYVTPVNGFRNDFSLGGAWCTWRWVVLSLGGGVRPLGVSGFSLGGGVRPLGVSGFSLG